MVDSLVDAMFPSDTAARWPQLPDETARQWLLPPVWERMVAGRGEFLADLRPAVPVFVRFGGLDFESDPQAPDVLDAFVTRAEQALDEQGGYVLQLTIGDKGAYLYAVFGVAHRPRGRRRPRLRGRPAAARDRRGGARHRRPGGRGGRAPAQRDLRPPRAADLLLPRRRRQPRGPADDAGARRRHLGARRRRRRGRRPLRLGGPAGDHREGTPAGGARTSSPRPRGPASGGRHRRGPQRDGRSRGGAGAAAGPVGGGRGRPGPGRRSSRPRPAPASPGSSAAWSPSSSPTACRSRVVRRRPLATQASYAGWRGVWSDLLGLDEESVADRRDRRGRSGSTRGWSGGPRCSARCSG